jgi:uncharacterized protein (TIGR00251 family)
VSIDESGVRLRIAAPPLEGKANRAVIAFISSTLGIPASRITLLRGAAGRHKVVEVAGVTTEEALNRLRPA